MLFRNDPYSRGTRTSYRIALIDAMRHFRMAPFFSRLSRADERPRQDSAVRWTLPYLVYQAILMAWDDGQTQTDRFTHALEVVVDVFWSRRRPGNTYQGFIKVLRKNTPLIDRYLAPHLRGEHRRVAGPFWRRFGFQAFAADGSRVEVPRTAANKAALGCAGRKKTGPQLGVTVMYHMGTGLPWDWRIGPGTFSERDHLREMVGTLPNDSLVVSDAGFTGYELLTELDAGGTMFLLRVGANVMLLQKLGLEVSQHGSTVYLWPCNKRKQPPLKLRLIRVPGEPGKKDVCLVTNVFDESRLSHKTAATLYEMRWGVEVFYRSFKETLGNRKMRSAAPENAKLECHWALTGMLLLGLMSVEGIVEAKTDPLALSVASALRMVRHAMRTHRHRRERGDLRASLASALKDGYERRGSKNAHDWPHKKNEPPPGEPKIRTATEHEKALA